MFAGADDGSDEWRPTPLFRCARRAPCPKPLVSGSVSDDEVHGKFATLVKKLTEAKSGYELTTANRMYAQQGMSVVPEFLDVLDKHYRSTVHSVDFKTEADRAMKEINDWVADTTKQRIKNLLSPGVLTAGTRLVLVNAIYFKGAWEHQFKESNTKKAAFYTLSNQEKEV